MSQDKAQSAVNGYSLNKGCNAVLGYLWASLRARREAVICGVASLVKGTPLPATQNRYRLITLKIILLHSVSKTLVFIAVCRNMYERRNT